MLSVKVGRLRWQIPIFLPVRSIVFVVGEFLTVIADHEANIIEGVAPLGKRLLVLVRNTVYVYPEHGIPSVVTFENLVFDPSPLPSPRANKDASH